ncbi:AAA family ATPase [Sphingomonas panni]|uniref:AAA family ATPase n=1 Tax=Sphingomonas panni TaxID=237612 RepID=UPI001F5B9EFC|nr:AAA family ATPase [Sphingomonas panni]
MNGPGRHASGGECLEGRVPVARIARSWNGVALPLGLDEQFELRGGDALPPHRLLAEVGLDWAPELELLVGQACLRQTVTGRHWFSMPPTVLLGEPGVGRAHAARRIAQVAGLPFTTLRASTLAGSRFDHNPAGTDVLLPSALVLIMATSGCANPVVLVDGIDDANDQALDALRTMIDPVSAERWMEPALAAMIDLRHVSWLLPSSCALGVPRQMSRLPRARIVCADMDGKRLRAISLICEAMHDLRVDRTEIEARGRSMVHQIATSSCSTASELGLLAERLLSTDEQRP